MWIFYYWPIFKSVSFLFPQTLCWIRPLYFWACTWVVVKWSHLFFPQWVGSLLSISVAQGHTQLDCSGRTFLEIWCQKYVRFYLMDPNGELFQQQPKSYKRFFKSFENCRLKGCKVVVHQTLRMIQLSRIQTWATLIRLMADQGAEFFSDLQIWQLTMLQVIELQRFAVPIWKHITNL